MSAQNPIKPETQFKQGEFSILEEDYKEKLEAFKNRRAKEGAGVSKRDVQKYLKKQQQQNDEPVNNAFAQALAGLKLDK